MGGKNSVAGQVGSFLGFGGAPKAKGFSVPGYLQEYEKQALERQQAIATGKSPSYSELGMQMGMDELARQRQSAVASQRGASNPALLERQAMQAQQQGGLDVARETAANKLAEQRAADAFIQQAFAASQGVALQQELANQQARIQNRGQTFQLVGNLGAAGAKAAAGSYAGGEVEGEPQVPGDSPINDTEPHMLSPGEIVIPRSAAKDRDSAMAFLDALKFKNEKNKPKKEESEVEEPAKEQEVDFHAMAKGMAALLQSMAEQNKKK